MEQLAQEKSGPPTPRWQVTLLVLFVASFAFFLASFPARNPDLWMHLAAGREVAHGQLPFHQPPLASVESRSSQSWLYDLVTYGLYSVAGGAGLVLGKALVVVGLGLILLRLSRVETGWWLPVFCTLLALLAIGTRMLLQPVTVSYLLFALTLLTLRRRGDSTSDRTVPFLPAWPLIVLSAVWANVDSRFVIGLATVGLIWLGQTLDVPRTAGRLRQLLHRGIALVVLGLVCLLNPSHIHAFTLPTELMGTGLDEVSSPFQRTYLTRFGKSSAALAYYPLLVFGLLTFILNLSHWRWQRFLPWLGLAVLSVVQVRAVPFFALVGGPVLAWNLQDLYARRVVRSGRALSGIRLLGARTLVGGLGLVLLGCAWPGWLQAPPFEPRRWAIETPPALERCANATLRWHEQGRLGPQSHALHLSVDTLLVFSWFCPEDRGILAAQLVPHGGTPNEWSERMREEGITHAIVYDSDRDRLFAALEQFLADPDQWPLLYLEGDLAVFGWRDPMRADAKDSFQGWELNLNRLAYHPAADKVAPRQRPEHQPRRWWEAFWKPAAPRPIDRDEAALHLLHAEALRRSAGYRHLSAWEATQVAGLAAAAASWTGPGGLLDTQLRLTLYQPPLPQPGNEPPSTLSQYVAAAERGFSMTRDDTPPALLYLAVRAARRALAVNPADTQANLILGESYLRLLQSTRERVWARRMPELYQLRCAQASAALNRALTLRPSLVQAHRSLGQLYLELGYIDLATWHFRASLDETRKAGPPRGVSDEQFRRMLARAEEELAPVAQAARELEQAYATESSGARVLDRAQLAKKKGLAGKARDILLASDVSAFGPEGLALELELLTMTGRYQDARDWMTVEHEAALGEGNYRWQRILAAGAAGDYAAADEELAQLAGASRGFDIRGPQEALALAVGRAVLNDRPTERLSFATLSWRIFGRIEFSDRVRSLVRNLSQRADVTALRGLLALEVGEASDADVAFRLALAYWDTDARTGVDFNGRVMAQDCLGWLE